jgi:hypothetical protein
MRQQLRKIHELFVVDLHWVTSYSLYRASIHTDEGLMSASSDFSVLAGVISQAFASTTLVNSFANSANTLVRMFLAALIYLSFLVLNFSKTVSNIRLRAAFVASSSLAELVGMCGRSLIGYPDVDAAIALVLMNCAKRRPAGVKKHIDESYINFIFS